MLDISDISFPGTEGALLQHLSLLHTQRAETTPTGIFLAVGSSNVPISGRWIGLLGEF
jgi:hypothetical protein